MYLVASGATQSLKIEVKDEVDFLHPDKHQSFLQVNFNTWYRSFLQGDYYKVVPSHRQH